MATKKRDSFEVQLDEQELRDLTSRLVQAIDDGLAAREHIVGDDQAIDRWHQLYEGGDRKITKSKPWPGAANLTSWLATEKVDTFRSRVVKTIFAEPIWVVEGWGSAAANVSFVEQFHQWKAEEERLQTYLSKVIHNALIEGTGVLEVGEKPITRKVRERARVMVQKNSFGEVIYDKKRQPVPMMDEAGGVIRAMPDTPNEDTTIVTLDRVGKVRGGPQYRVLSLKDFLVLPGHAQERGDVWGYAKRFWKRVGELKVMEKMGVYEGVDELGSEDEREQTPEMRRENVTVEDQQGPAAEKELWEFLFLADLKDEGVERWYVCTLHKDKQKILRLQHDDVGQGRYLLFTPFPRSNFIYGYSLIGHKLETILDEHTAWRNMIADRSHLVAAAPIKKTIGSLWNPKAVPWAPGAIIPVRDQSEVQAMVVPDVPSSLLNREGMVMSAAERVTMVDTAAGAHPDQERTLGEVKTVLSQSLIRVEEVVKHLQEAMEELFVLRHDIWKRTLREADEPMQVGTQAAMEQRGFKLPAELTPLQMLEGTFRGKPRASVESAEPQVQRQDFIQFVTSITQMAQAVPSFAAMFQQPELSVSFLKQAMRLFRWEDKATMEQALQKVLSNPQIGQAMAQAGAQRGPGKEPPKPAQQQMRDRQGGEV